MIDIRDRIHTIDPDVLESVELFVSRIWERFGDKILVILFGSHARGDYGPDSDVDLIVLIFEESFDLQYALIGMGCDLFLEKGVLLFVKIMTKEHYEAKRDYLFFREMNRKGVIVA